MQNNVDLKRHSRTSTVNLSGKMFLTRISKSKMTKDLAMKVLGLSRGNNKTREGIPKKLENYTEEEILEAFQEQSMALSKS